MSAAARIAVGAARQTIIAACRAVGASPANARALAEATLWAEWHGRAEMGCAHLLDYLDSLRAGRIDGQAVPRLHQPLPALIHADGAGGIAQAAFDAAFAPLVTAANGLGIALFTLANSYTAGELGYYVRRLATQGLVALATANSHAMLAAAPGAGGAVYGTNPLAFAAPRPAPQPPLVFDQASSATAWVNLQRAASTGAPIPAGWALDATGNPTTDPARALLGTLLPAGGRKGANLAMMVEVLAAGLSGGNWSLDAGHFQHGGTCPGTGLSVIALAPAALAPDFATRLEGQLERLGALGVHIPGATAPATPPADDDLLNIAPAIWAQVVATSA